MLNATWVPIIYLFFPETKGLELEDVDRLFEGQGGASDVMRGKDQVDGFHVEVVKG